MVSPVVPSPPARRAAPLPAAERRSRIIDAALPLLVENGLAATTRQIANAAGVAEGTIFSVFTGKDELVAAVFERAIEPGPFEQAILAIDPTESFENQLVQAVDVIQRRVVDIWRLVSSLGPRHHPSPPRPLPDSPALAALLSTEPDRLRVGPVESARLLRSLTLSLTHPLLAAEPHCPSDIVDVFLHGVGGRS